MNIQKTLKLKSKEEIEKKSSDIGNNKPNNVEESNFIAKEVLVFDIVGPNAHFRNIQTNSTSLSYYFPPPTTIFGLIAGICGFSRDSYYDQINSKNSFLGIEVLTPLRKELFTVNYRVYGSGEKGYTQIPMELVFPKDSSEIFQSIRYRIYFASTDEELMRNIHRRLEEDNYVYPPYLGLTEMLANIEFVGNFKMDKLSEEQKVTLNCILPQRFFQLNIAEMKEIVIFPEYMRSEFSKNREPGKMKKYFYIAQGEINVKSGKNSELYAIKMSDRTNIIARL